MSAGKSDNILENYDVEQQCCEGLRSYTIGILVDVQFVWDSIAQVHGLRSWMQ
jgi:hypothetical protein